MDGRRGGAGGWWSGGGGADGEDGPGADADPVAVVERHPDAAWYLTAVDHRAVRRARVEQHPAAVRFRHQDGMQMRDARVGRRASQVDLWFEPAGHAAPADAHLLTGQPEPALGAVPGELDRGGVRAALRDHAVVVGAVRGN